MYFDPNALTGVDLFGDYTEIMWDDTPVKTVYLRRIGNDQMEIREEWKDFSAMLEDNVRKQNEFSNSSKLGNLVHVGSVPMALQRQWELEGLDDDQIWQRLNSSDYSKLRTNNLQL